MAIPDYQSIMLPLLKLASDGNDQQLGSAIRSLAEQFGLTEEDLTELLPSGRQPRFHNRVAWARTYLAKALLLESPSRGIFRISSRGRTVLDQNPTYIGNDFLAQFDEFVAFRIGGNKRDLTISEIQRQEMARTETPEESIEEAYRTIRADLATLLLDNVRECSAQFFERLVVDLLVTMGYGGSRQEAGEAIGRAGDGGVDGIIKEDVLGLDVIYVQAKRWQVVVGRPSVQQFAGALQGLKANKGVFLTTSTFTSHAMEYAAGLDRKIILISGVELAELMIDHGIGVTPTVAYRLNRIDSDYFSEE